jgi:hypothetical protein
MRGRFLAFVAAALAVAGIFSSAAFNDASGATRRVTIAMVGDSAAYLKLAGNGAHACIVQQDATTGKASLSFGAVSGCASGGAGLGINAGSGAKYARYAFHDVVKITNAGQKTVKVWVNATTTTAGANWINVAKSAAALTMTESDYYNASSTSISLVSTGSLYVGVRLNTTLAAGNALAGTVTVDARS